MTTKKQTKYTCDACVFTTFNKKDYNRHLITQKHINIINNLNNTDNLFVCNCGKKYKHKSSYYKHRKNCTIEINNIETNNNNNNNININKNNDNEDNSYYKDVIVNLIKENHDIKEIMKKQQEQISELIPKIGNNNNNKVNINVFLNEQCKDAMSIDDFIKSIEISLKNLVTTKNKGLAIGLNEIINENMNKLSIYERPVHCTDKKRETLYIKNEIWEKDNEKSATSGMLKSLQLEQIKSLHKWIDEHPDYKNNDKETHEYTLLINKCTCSFDEHEKAMFKNLCESTYLKDL